MTNVYMFPGIIILSGESGLGCSCSNCNSTGSRSVIFATVSVGMILQVSEWD